MRRGSVVAPLLLIAIGALFLFRNLYPDVPMMDYLARYWPFLLIAWGLLRLGEILFWAAASKPLPARGVVGGEWLLVLFLIFVGSSIHAALGFPAWWARAPFGGIEMFGESFEYPLSGQKASSKTPRVVVESFRGNARIVGGDLSEVKVTGRQTIRSLNQSGADRAHQDAPFELAGDENRIVIRTNQDRVAGSPRVSDELEITVPKGASIEAHGRAGDFDLTGIDGKVEITSDRAGVRLQDLGGDVRMDLQHSDIVRAMNLKGALDLKGGGGDLDLQDIGGPVTISGGGYVGSVEFRNLSKPLHFTGPLTELSIEQLPGDVRMPLGDFTASDLVGPVHLSTRSRDVQISDFTNSLDLSVEGRGDITLRPGKLPLARIEAHTRSGNVELSLPPAAKFDLTASATRGEVSNDFGDPLKLEYGGRGATLRGSVGSGPVVNVQTDRGQLVIRKASPDDKPLTPHGIFSRPPIPLLPPIPPAPPLPQRGPLQ